MRLDQLLVEKYGVKSRTYAKKLIEAWKVCVEGKTASKASSKVNETVKIELMQQQPERASRGAYKLLWALEYWGIETKNTICFDIGASTWGFTDILLSRGAQKVFAIDVGHDQLDPKLVNHPKVENREWCNARYLDEEEFSHKWNFAVIDVSFISLKKIIPALLTQLETWAQIVALVKPQFEAGKQAIGKWGIIKDPEVHTRVIDDIKKHFLEQHCEIIWIIDSPITGGDGNKEFLLYAKKE